MKRTLLLCTFTAASALLALSVPTPAAAAEKAGSASTKAPFEFTWERVQTRELMNAVDMFQRLREGVANGTVSRDEIAVVERQLRDLEQRAPYSLNVRSAGGPLSAFLAVMSQSKEVSMTLINAGEPIDLETPLPAFNLRNAHWGTLVNVLGVVLNTRGLELNLAGSDTPNPADSKNVVCVLRRNNGWWEKKEAAQPTFESFQLAEYLDTNATTATQDFETIADAIQSAWKLEGSVDRTTVRLRFHPATKMLFVSGPSQAIGIARQVIKSLSKKPVQR